METLLGNPSHKRMSGAFRDLKLDRTLRLLLHDNSAAQYAVTVAEIPDPQRDEIATAELAVYCQVEERPVTGFVGELEPDSDGPNFALL